MVQGRAHLSASLELPDITSCSRHGSAILTGHVAGLLVGSYLGAGLSPKMVSSVDRHTLEESAEEVVDPVKLDVLHVSHKGAFRRWAAYASFAATLSLLAAGTVVSRTGELPMPKGLDLLSF